MNSNKHRHWLLAVLMACTLALSGCLDQLLPNSSDSETPIEEEHEDNGSPTDPPPPVVDPTLLPLVVAGNRQYADANVLITLEGEVQAAAGSHIVHTVWTQTRGPQVVIPRPQSLRNLIMAPEVHSPQRLEFRLTAEDSEGRVSSATTSVFVHPQPGFLRVIGGILEPVELEGVFTLRLNQPAASALSVSYSTLSGTAVAGVDFVPTSGTLEFQPGDVSREVTVSLLPQTSAQEERAFILRASWQQSDGSHLNATGTMVILGALQVEIPGDNNPPDDEEPPIEPEDPPSSVRFSALVSGDGSLVHFTDGASGFQFFRARNSDCDIDALTQCIVGQEDLLGDTAIIDNALTLNDEAYYWLRYNGSQSYPLHVVGDSNGVRQGAPPERLEHQLLTFNERLWLIGGESVDAGEQNQQMFHDVWTSNDGIYWFRTTDSLTGSAESYYGIHKAVNYNGALWAFDEESERLYRSTNGSDWEARDDSLPELDNGFRLSQQLVVLGEQLLMIGNVWMGSYQVEVLSYHEDSGWSDWRDNPPFSSMFGVRAVVFNEELWLIGPVLEQDWQETSGLWRSPNGVDWTEERDTNRSFGDYSEHQVAVFRDRLWVVGGAYSESEGITSEVWSSGDGSFWQLETVFPGFAPRYGFQLAVFNDKLWLHGGFDYYQEEEPTVGDTWVTEDGVNWKRVYRGIIHFPVENGGPALVFE